MHDIFGKADSLAAQFGPNPAKDMLAISVQEFCIEQHRT